MARDRVLCPPHAKEVRHCTAQSGPVFVLRYRINSVTEQAGSLLIGKLNEAYVFLPLQPAFLSWLEDLGPDVCLTAAYGACWSKLACQCA